MSLRHGRSHQTALVATLLPPLSPSQSPGAGTQPHLALQPAPQKSPGTSATSSHKSSSRKPTEDAPCTTLHSYPSSSPNPSVSAQKVQQCPSAVVSRMEIVRYCPSLPNPPNIWLFNKQNTVTATENIKARPHISASENINVHLKKCLLFGLVFVF